MPPALDMPRPRRPWRRSPAGLHLPPAAGDVSLEAAGAILAAQDRRRVTAFDPASLGASLWLVSGAAWATTDTAGTTPVTATGQAVANVRNRGSLGSAADGVPSVSNARPVVQQLNPLRLTLDGSDDYVPIGSSAIVVGGAQWLAARFRLSSASSAYRCLLTLAGASHRAILYVNAQAPERTLTVALGGTTGTSLSVGYAYTPDTAWHSVLVEYAGGGPGTVAQYTIWLDGVSVTPVAQAAVTVPDYSGLGATITSGFGRYAGDLGPLLYGAGTLTSTQRAGLLAYLGAS